MTRAQTSPESRSPVISRDAAASVLLWAVTRASWAMAATILVLAIPPVLTLPGMEDSPADLTVAIFCLLGMAGLIGVMAWRPSAITLGTYLVVGAVLLAIYLAVLAPHVPELTPQYVYILNRPATALVAIGTCWRSPLTAIAWCGGGYLAATVVTALVGAQFPGRIGVGNGPIIAFILCVFVYGALEFINRRLRRRVPDFGELRHETDRITAELAVEQRAVAVVHDTVLNDLAFVINAPSELDDRMRDRLRSDIAVLSTSDWLESPQRDVILDSSNARFRNQMMTTISEMQWRGLTVDISGISNEVLHVAPEVGDAGLRALTASFENVLRHSGVNTAELILSRTDDMVTMMVVDAGRGFAPGDVESDRLGLRMSVIRRVEEVGGSARVFSAPGRGTSVMISLPISSTPEPELDAPAGASSASGAVGDSAVRGVGAAGSNATGADDA